MDNRLNQVFDLHNPDSNPHSTNLKPIVQLSNLKQQAINSRQEGNQMVGEDLESGPAGHFNYAQEFTYNARIGFIRKVYSILSIQLLVTFLITFACMTVDSLRDFFYNSEWSITLMWVAFAALMISMCILGCCIETARQVPINYILLTIFTLAESYMVASVCVLVDAPELVLAAAFLAGGMTVALTIYAFTTESDPTWGAGTLVICFAGMILSLPLMFFTTLTFIHVVYSFLVVTAYGVFLFHDTQLIVKENRYSLGVDDYIIAALIIYVDIIVIFLRILEILAQLTKK